MYDSWIEISSLDRTKSKILFNDSKLKSINLEMIKQFSYWYIRFKYGMLLTCWQIKFPSNTCDSQTSLLSMAKEQNMESYFGEIIFNYIKQYDYLFVELVDKINKIHNQMDYERLPWYKKIFRSSCG
jgi:hypothetical protein